MVNGIAIKRPPERVVLTGSTPNVVNATSKIFDFPSGWNETNTRVISFSMTLNSQRYFNDPRVFIFFDNGQINMFIFVDGAAFQNVPLEVILEKI